MHYIFSTVKVQRTMIESLDENECSFLMKFLNFVGVIGDACMLPFVRTSCSAEGECAARMGWFAAHRPIRRAA